MTTNIWGPNLIDDKKITDDLKDDVIVFQGPNLVFTQIKFGTKIVNFYVHDSLEILDAYG